VRELKAALPEQIILAGGSAALEHGSELLAAGCFELSSTREQARRTVRRYALQRARSRLGAAARLLPGFTLKPESDNQASNPAEPLAAVPLATKE